MIAVPTRQVLGTGEVVEIKHPIERAPAFWEHGRDPADAAWSASIERRDAVFARAPAAAEASAMVEAVNLRSSIVPIDLERAQYAPAGEPFASGVEVVDHYAEHPTDGAGIVTGPQGGGWGVLAIRDETGAGWAAWTNAHAAYTVRVSADKYDKPSGRRNYDMTKDHLKRPLGLDVLVRREPIIEEDPYHLPKVRAFRGNVNAGTMAALASVTVAQPAPERFLLKPYLGTWSFKRRGLADGLWLLPSGSVVPVAGQHDGYSLRLHGASVLQVDANDAGWYGWAPPWLLANLGGRR